MQGKQKQRIQGWRWWLVLLLASWPTMVMAHGSGAPRLVNVVAGPYRLWVWSLPDPIRVGEAHLSVAVEEAVPLSIPQSTPQSTAIAVQITLNAVDQPNQQFTVETSKQDRFLQTYYEADFTMPTVGEWQATVGVSSAAGVGTAAFPFAVLPPQHVNWELVFWSAIMVVAILWAVRQYRDPAKPPA